MTTRRLLTGSHMVRLVATGRVAMGLGMVVRPDRMPRVLGVDSVTAGRMSWAMRMLGIREVALGAGTLMAARRTAAGPPGDRSAGAAAGPSPALTAWVLGGAASDAVDAYAFGDAARRGVVRPWLGAALAVFAAAVAAGQVASLTREEAPLD